MKNLLLVLSFGFSISSQAVLQILPDGPYQKLAVLLSEKRLKDYNSVLKNAEKKENWSVAAALNEQIGDELIRYRSLPGAREIEDEAAGNKLRHKTCFGNISKDEQFRYCLLSDFFVPSRREECVRRMDYSLDAVVEDFASNDTSHVMVDFLIPSKKDEYLRRAKSCLTSFMNNFPFDQVPHLLTICNIQEIWRDNYLALSKYKNPSKKESALEVFEMMKDVQEKVKEQYKNSLTQLDEKIEGKRKEICRLEGRREETQQRIIASGHLSFMDSVLDKLAVDSINNFIGKAFSEIENIETARARLKEDIRSECSAAARGVFRIATRPGAYQKEREEVEACYARMLGSMWLMKNFRDPLVSVCSEQDLKVLKAARITPGTEKLLWDRWVRKNRDVAKLTK